MFRIHNRYLPDWFHRAVNASVVAFIWGIGTGYTWLSAAPDSLLGATARWASSLTPVILIGMLFVRHSVVRGVAGGDGYDELRRCQGARGSHLRVGLPCSETELDDLR